MGRQRTTAGFCTPFVLIFEDVYRSYKETVLRSEDGKIPGGLPPYTRLEHGIYRFGGTAPFRIAKESSNACACTASQHQWAPQSAKDRERHELYEGELKVAENWLHRLGRAVICATVVNVVDNVEVTMLEIYDVVLLWSEKSRMRLRGFEDAAGVQYAQTWDLEIV